MNTNTIPVFIGIFWGSMPFWLNYASALVMSISARKIILVSLYVLYNLVPIYLLTRLTPNSFADQYLPYLFLCAFVLHWILTTYTIRHLWPRTK